MIKMGVPIRGCIICGEYERFKDDQRGIVIAGKPIIEAYDYERIQNWIGIMVSPSVLEAFPKLPKNVKIGNTPKLLRNIKNTMPNSIYCQRGSIPFKTKEDLDQPFEGYAIIPIEINCSSPQELIHSLRQTIATLDNLIIRAPSLKDQRKYLNTLNYLKTIRKCWNDIINKQESNA